MNNIIKKAIVSEKSFQAASKSRFTFIVERHAKKEEIASEVKELFGVTVLGVNCANYKGKIKQTKRVKGKRSDYKKAIIQVKSGEKIDLFEIEKDAASTKGRASVSAGPSPDGGTPASTKSGMRGVSKVKEQNNKKEDNKGKNVEVTIKQPKG